MPQVAHKIHNHQRPRLQVLNNYDPTRTTTLRTQFAAEMGRRFRALRGIIRKAIIDQNCFGLTRQDELYLLPSAYGAMTLPGHNAFAFPRSSDKVEGFMEWLGQQQEIGILEMPGSQIGRGVEQAWTNKYIQSSYQKGIVRARQELRKAGYRSRAGDEIPALETGGQISAAFNQPFHADRVGLLYSRTFSDLKGITAAMDTQISRVLAQGIADGLPPRQIAKLLTRTISGPVGGLGITDTLGRFIPAERRAKILARTEIIRAHHSATIQEYKNWGAEGVTVRAEWTTAGDGRVCADCAALEGKEFSLAQIESKIPLHPQCRCLALPLDMTGKEKAPPIESKISNEEFRKLEDASTKDVFNYGEKNGKEKLIAISDSGQIRSATGAYEEVGFSTKVQREIDGWNNVTVVHNHPLEQTFSTGDIVQFGDLPGFRRGLITRPSGQIDELFKPSGVVFDRRKASSVLARQREILVDDFMDLVTSGTMTKEVALERSLIQALEENGLKFNHRKTPTIPTIKKPVETPFSQVREKKGVQKRETRGHLEQKYNALSPAAKNDFVMDMIKMDNIKSGVEISSSDILSTRNAFEAFQSSEYGDIRNVQFGRKHALGSNIPYSIGTIKRAKRQAAYMEDYLTVAPSFTQNKTLYRGMMGQREVFDALKKGDVWDTKALSSWTTKRDIGRHFATTKDSVLVKIRSAPRNSTSIGNITDNFGEAEVIMSGKTKLRIVAKKRISGNPEILEVTLEEVL